MHAPSNKGLKWWMLEYKRRISTLRFCLGTIIQMTIDDVYKLWWSVKNFVQNLNLINKNEQ